MTKGKKIIYILAIIILSAVLFIGGWLLRGGPEVYLKSNPMRLGGFKFVKPLLVCDTSSEKKYPELQILENKLDDFVKNEKMAGDVNSVSIYFQDFKTDGRIDINKDEKFRSASIGKVPIMIAFYKMSESDPGMFKKIIKYSIEKDLNEEQEIKPIEYAKAGNTYTVEELIERMIKYSDNNSTYALVNSINFSTFKSIYTDLQIPFPVNIENPEIFDYITSKDVSYLFRVLYNGSYLSNELSDQALQLLSETNYKNGLAAGVPLDINVAHKFGSDTLQTQGAIEERQLHDCGIVFHSKNPYLLCVMTKSSADVSHIEKTIQGISSIVYQQVDAYSK